MHYQLIWGYLMPKRNWWEEPSHDVSCWTPIFLKECTFCCVPGKESINVDSSDLCTECLLWSLFFWSPMIMLLVSWLFSVCVNRKWRVTRLLLQWNWWTRQSRSQVTRTEWALTQKGSTMTTSLKALMELPMHWTTLMHVRDDETLRITA